jgi:hypothetical protein
VSGARASGAALLIGALFAACNAGAQEPAHYRNVTTGGPLRPGVYGRIVIKGEVPPPVIYPTPRVANETLGEVRSAPVYLYVPPGQVRKWKQSCVRWSACDAPVLFVRVDDSPSRWGRWRALREDLALRVHD